MKELEERIRELEHQNEELHAQLAQNSTNSSRPPSTDPPGTQRSVKREVTGKPPGGQPGHEKHERALLPVEQVSQVVEVVPERCEGCGHPLEGEDGEAERHQLVEIEPIVARVTEYRCHRLHCSRCGRSTQAPLPPEAQQVFGERLSALVCLLRGQYHLSERQAQQLLGDVLGVKLSLGMVPRLSQQMSQALEVAVHQAEVFVREQAVIHADETGWKQGVNERHACPAWLWVFATPQVVSFRIALSHGQEVWREVLGNACCAFLVSDRAAVYAGYDVGLRQGCWSHLLRDFKSWSERPQPVGRWGQQLVEQAHKLFEGWHQFKQGALSRPQLQAFMGPLEQSVRSLLREVSLGPDEKSARSARQILKLGPALWTFEDVPGVEPTNNFAEQCLRQAVLWRKSSGGTHSPGGSRFVERILTVVTSLRRQGRALLPWLTQALRALRRGQSLPSLLPQGSV
ncbi:IS66 family transposase [Stigmatella sp. ncwal1]|uniref:IS66 family transposase n=1 Tax=Stigmatella ashevillensis TaxID=2995309 RepID=A0ABT5DKL8_9BACT|nr:IS66 family transposase [Stigmatella ashevillena]MDC0714210.1 IS66 family transposase [Stigmatella ashevillena]